MDKAIIGLLIVLSQGVLFSQSPKVPHKMKVGDVKLKITEGARAEIQKSVDELTKHPKYFNAKVDLANQYFHFIEDAFKKEGIPEDIKYLIIQESGFISDAVSTSNAVGFWQFKDFTAVEMGLRVDRHIDERKNIVSASIGAAKYMKRNNSYFDNWVYAIQAYQMGAGGALKVTDEKFYGVRQMTITKKTYWYVKKYLAHKVAYENAVGKSNPSVYLSAYKLGSGKSLKNLAKKFKVNENELVKYNKWLKKGNIPSDKKYHVIIPDKQPVKVNEYYDNSTKPKNIFVKKAPSYNQAQAKYFPAIKPWKGNAKYSESTININKLPGIKGMQGDKLIDLAKKGNLSLSNFLNINDIGIEHKVIKGQVYYFKKKKSKAKVYYHILHPDETLWSVSQKYGIQLKKLIIKNRITEGEKIKATRVLWIRYIRPNNIPITYEKINDSDLIEINIDSLSAKSKADESQTKELFQIDSVNHIVQDTLLNTGVVDSVEYKKIDHIVKKGDTYYNIANRYKVKVLDLVKWNKLTLADKLFIDQQVQVFLPKNEVEIEQGELEDSEKESLENHLVSKGETLYSISIKYGLTIETLKRINNKTENEVAIGERLRISVKE